MPLFLLIALILKFTGEGEIFFLQERVGKQGKFFKLYKFATMLKNSQHLGTGTVTLKNDPRILPFGIFLRKTKINELPQLINILKGDMSIIGPRPQTKRCFDAFPRKSQEKIISVRPGLSGIGSIIFRDEEEMISSEKDASDLYDNTIMPFKGELEEWFVDNRNAYIYFLLIFITILTVIFKKTNIVWKILQNLPEPPKRLEYWIKRTV